MAPRVLEDLAVLAQATGVVVSAHGVDQAGARQGIADAGRMAGLDEVTVARELIRPYSRNGEGLYPTEGHPRPRRNSNEPCESKATRVGCRRPDFDG